MKGAPGKFPIYTAPMLLAATLLGACMHGPLDSTAKHGVKPPICFDHQVEADGVCQELLPVDPVLHSADDPAWHNDAPTCTPVAHDFPCDSRGDNEPTWGGRGWTPVGSDLAGLYHLPRGCKYRIGETSWLVCPDGRWSSS